MRRLYIAAVGVLWAGDLGAATPFDQRAMDDGRRLFGQALRWPVEMAREHWYYIVGAVVVLLLVRSYLRK